MFVRIVKMSFDPKYVSEFLDLFHSKKTQIRNNPGCSLLELYRDKNNPNVFFTYSYWQAEEDLEKYRNSALFKEVWAQTKKYFKDKPLAWSVDKMVSLP